MTTGSIKTIVAERGFFFIIRDSDSSDVFGHCTALENLPFNDLKIGMRVRFEEGRDQNGRPRADSISVVTRDLGGNR